LTVMLNTGDGSFCATSRYAAGVQANTAVFGDFNSDGRPDIAIASHGDGTVGVLLNNGTPTP
ncbi:MAG TPA: VCBS repeat-containing protein, partial [Roseiflexaceae bacterium]|nr:VCBS repeat-containing protein [Roseiflexaceae bacterium]